MASSHIDFVAESIETVGHSEDGSLVGIVMRAEGGAQLGVAVRGHLMPDLVRRLYASSASAARRAARASGRSPTDPTVVEALPVSAVGVTSRMPDDSVQMYLALQDNDSPMPIRMNLSTAQMMLAELSSVLAS